MSLQTSYPELKTSHPTPNQPPGPQTSFRGGPGLTSFATSRSASDLPPPTAQNLQPLQAMCFYAHPAVAAFLPGFINTPGALFWPPSCFLQAEPRAYLFSQMKRYHRVVLSVKDEQGAGNVFHTVRQTMTIRSR